MYISYNWLQDFVKLPAKISPQDIAVQLTNHTVEVESFSNQADKFNKVVVGKVLEVSKHPNADRLRVTIVDVKSAKLHIVCGAPNVAPNQLVAVALEGALLPNGLEIKKSDIRGETSEGMICAEDELGLGDDHEGIMVLDKRAKIGQPFAEYLKLTDIVFEVDNKSLSNRPDLLSHYGIARELSVIFDAKLKPYDKVIGERLELASEKSGKLEVEVIAKEACPRYLAIRINNVKVKESPAFVRERLLAAGQRPINNIVDLTNYVMLECGQPLHAFDLAQIKGGICVRMAQDNEKITVLDGQEITLKANTLVIADQHRALAIAGVMGGADSGVTLGKTTDIFLESAFFEPIAIAGKARSYGLHTDASHRFERGVDWQLPAHAVERATELLLSIVGGSAGPVLVTEDAGHLPKLATITLRAERVKQMFGLDLSHEQIESLLMPLGLSMTVQEAGVWSVEVPSHRFDITIEVDLLEEIGRLYGYDQLPVRYPAARLAPQAQSEAQAQLPVLRRLLVARGYQEAITYSFIEPEVFTAFHPELKPLTLANPISAELSVMRASLLPGLLKALQHNLNRQQDRVRLFESGLRFVGQLDDLKQERMLAGVITGARLPELWTHGKETVDFYDIKADVEALLGAAGDRDGFTFVPCQQHAFHPGQCARIEHNGQAVGFVGTLHPQLAIELDIDQQVLMFEVQLDAISTGRLPTFTELSRFPEVRRDLALVVNADIPAQELMDAMRSAAGEWLTQIRLFDVYQGKGVEEGCKSLAVGLTWQHPSRTLTDEEVSAATQAILALLSDKFAAILRK